MRNRPLSKPNLLLLALLVSTVLGPRLADAAPQSPRPAQEPPSPRVVSETQQQGPQIVIDADSIVIDWGEREGMSIPYHWRATVHNPNERPIGVKVRLDFVDEQGEPVYKDWIAGQVGPDSSVTLQQQGELRADLLDEVYEAHAEPSAWWLEEPYKIRTLAAFVDGLQRLEVFFVLEDWRGRPVTANGTVDLYVVEKERARAEFAGGGMRRRLTTLYARRFNIHGDDFARRRIGFVSTDYSPPAVTLGPIHYSIFDHEPIADEGLVRLVFRTASGREIVGEDRVYF